MTDQQVPQQQPSLQSLFGIDAAVAEIKTTLVSEEVKNTLIGVGKVLIKDFITDFAKTSKQTIFGGLIPSQVAEPQEGKVDVNAAAVTIAEEAEEVVEEVSLLDVAGNLMSESVKLGIMRVLGDPDYFPMVVAILRDSVYSVIEESLADKEARLEKMLEQIGVKLMGNETVKGGFADAVYHGGKRISTDAEAQKAIATISKMIMTSQDTQNVIKTAIDTGMVRIESFFASDKFLDKVGSLSDQNIAGLQDILDVIIKEAMENILGMKVSLIGTLGGATPEQGAKEDG